MSLLLISKQLFTDGILSVHVISSSANAKCLMQSRGWINNVEKYANSGENGVRGGRLDLFNRAWNRGHNGTCINIWKKNWRILSLLGKKGQEGFSSRKSLLHLVFQYQCFTMRSQSPSQCSCKDTRSTRYLGLVFAILLLSHLNDINLSKVRVIFLLPSWVRGRILRSLWSGFGNYCCDLSVDQSINQLTNQITNQSINSTWYN